MLKKKSRPRFTRNKQDKIFKLREFSKIVYEHKMTNVTNGQARKYRRVHIVNFLDIGIVRYKFKYWRKMILGGKEKGLEEQSEKAPESSKSFNRITTVGLVLYIFIIALIVVINFTEKTENINELTNIIFILSPILFTKFLKERYEYLHTKEYYNNSRNDKEIDFENKALTFLLSAMATFPMIVYLVIITLRSVDHALYLVIIILLGLLAAFIYYVFTAVKFPEDNDKNGSKENSEENNSIPPSS